MYYGNYVGAAYGIDGQINPTIFEWECPNCETLGFTVLWIDIPSRAMFYQLGSGIWTYNFKDYPSNALKTDTFNLHFHDDDFLENDFTFRWPGRDYLSARCDSMFFKYRYVIPATDTTNYVVVNVRINMFTQDSTVITRPGDLSLYDQRINNALIIKYGTKDPI